MNAVVMHAGAPLQGARGVVVLLHGRGGSARDILSLAPELSSDKTIAFLAPQAEDSTWYPMSFLASREQNEPKLSAALHTVAEVVASAEAVGIRKDRIVLAGFSQGACLATEYVASHPERYAGLIAFTGGLIGPLGSDVSKMGDLSGMPAFLGSGDPDPHVPWSRVEESAAVLRGMGAIVELRRYPGKPHSVSRDEIEAACGLIANAF